MDRVCLRPHSPPRAVLMVGKAGHGCHSLRGLVLGLLGLWPPNNPSGGAQDSHSAEEARRRGHVTQ